jgi:hypothetical protein
LHFKSERHRYHGNDRLLDAAMQSLGRAIIAVRLDRDAAVLMGVDGVGALSTRSDSVNRGETPTPALPERAMLVSPQAGEGAQRSSRVQWF